jgi:hypothetical protein
MHTTYVYLHSGFIEKFATALSLKFIVVLIVGSGINELFEFEDELDEDEDEDEDKKFPS